MLHVIVWGILLAIGNAYTITGCHVMERESFMSQEVADILNADFIPVKIDREERPDVDAIYMNCTRTEYEKRRPADFV